MKKISLKWRFTILTAIILTIICIVMSVISISTVKNKFVDDFNFEAEMVDIEAIYTGNTFSTPSIGLEATLIQTSSDFNVTIIIVTVIVIVFGSATVYFVSNLFLSPIKELSLDIKDFQIDKLDKRIVHNGANDELKTLSVSFNEMMDKVEKGFLREKRFSANIAHELKTPLTTMKINLDVFKMSNDNLSEETEDLIRILQSQNTRMIELITSLLTFASADTMDLTEKIDLDEIISDVLLALNTEILNKDIDITTATTNIHFTGNGSLLKNAFSNIIENAIKYNTTNGKIDIFADEKQIIHIKDNGIGIEKKYLDKIFEPLFRVNQSRNRDIAGAGLGLALTSEIIKKHNGTITVLSDGKTYSEFMIDLTASF